MILMFLEEKEAEEQFVLSELTEYIQGQYREEQIDWTVYQYRRHLIKVIKYCVNCGILNLNDGSEENFARDDTSEVLYENTGVSRYFMKNFTQDIMGYTTPEDQAEKESLSDSDTVKLKQREVEIKSQLEGLKKNITGKQRQEEEKKEKYQETEQKIQLQFQKNEMLWEEIENSLEYMEEEMAGVPFDEFAFMKKELTEQKGEQYSFQAHSELLKDYMTKVRLGKTTLEEEKGCQERYSRFLQELDSYQEEKNKAEREVLQYENQFHEVKQETIESVYRWEKENAELHLQSDLIYCRKWQGKLRSIQRKPIIGISADWQMVNLSGKVRNFREKYYSRAENCPTDDWRKTEFAKNWNSGRIKRSRSRNAVKQWKRIDGF